MTRVLALALLLVPASYGGVVSVLTVPAALGADDYVDWGQLGADLTVVTGPAAVSSNLSKSATLTGPNDFFSVTQGNSFTANFTTGDNLLYNSAPGAFTLTFASAIQGAGLRFASGTFGGFTAIITAFGAGNTNFGSVSVGGTSSNAADGSAVFLGITSTAQDIVALTFNVQRSAADADFAVNRLLIQTQAPASGVPEPSTYTLGLLGLAAFGWMRRRRQ